MAITNVGGLRAFFSVICLLVTYFFPQSLMAGDELKDEASVRTAFVFNLTKYVTWPQAAADLVVCYEGDVGMGGTLKKVLQGQISGSRVFRVLTSNVESNQCDVVYINFESQAKNSLAVEKRRGQSVLTIGESLRFACTGGMIGLVRIGDRIQIQINPEATAAVNLKISSHLLNLGTLVRSRDGCQ